jgi:Holliday junction resolvasome RuvABC endonuclease subunit
MPKYYSDIKRMSEESGKIRRDRVKVILGLDLGTNCGYCYGFLTPKDEFIIEPWQMGIWDLSAGPYDSGAIRFVRLRKFLSALSPDFVAYEDVKFTPEEALTRFSAARVLARAATASELIGAFRATVVTWCEENNLPCTGFGVGTIKKFATNIGNASKEEIIKACNEKFKTDFDPETYKSTGVDNIADAAFICLLAYNQYSSGLLKDNI